jgi:translation initiation factor IF-3
MRPQREVVAIAQKREVRVNERIRIPQVRVIGSDGQQVGVMATRDAMTMAREQDLDLVEVSPDANPPVCRIMDFGKFKYEQSKRARKAKKKQHVMHVKEVKLRLKIEDHDYQFKVNNAKKFLEGRDKVKFTVTFRGRELDRVQLGSKLLERVIEDIKSHGLVELRPKREGRTLVMVVVPKPARKGGRPSDSGSETDKEYAEAKDE